MTTVVVNNPPKASANSNSPVCAGGTISLQSAGGVSYAWVGPNGFTSTEQNPTISNCTLANAGEYTVTVTDANGCVATAKVSVMVNSKPTATAGNNGPVCEGGTVTLLSGGGVSYAWTGPNGFTSNVQNPLLLNVTFAMAGEYTVTVTDANGCTATAKTTLVVNPLPICGITAAPWYQDHQWHSCDLDGGFGSGRPDL